jgi:hypothetical protein
MRSLDQVRPASFADFARFATAQLELRDVDPLYLVLGDLVADKPEEERLWGLVAYCAWYNLPSALTYLEATEWLPGVEPTLEQAKMPTNTERRALRGGHQMLRHFWSIAGHLDAYGGVRSWLAAGNASELGPCEAWRQVRANVEGVHGNGRWASYKMADLLASVVEWPLEAPDMGMDAGLGPVKGIRYLFGEPGSSSVAERWGQEARRHLAELGVNAGEPLPTSVVETLLCDYGSHLEGRYPPGHDTRELREATARLAPGPVRDRINAAIARTLPVSLRTL